MISALLLVAALVAIGLGLRALAKVKAEPTFVHERCHDASCGICRMWPKTWERER